MKVNTYVKGAVRQFVYWFAHGTIGDSILNDIDYISNLKEESSYAETAFIVFMNNLEFDDDNGVTNYKHAEFRAAQYIRSYFDSSYEVIPKFEEWEIEASPVSKDVWNV